MFNNSDNIFKLPIEYLECKKLDNNIIDNLELKNKTFLENFYEILINIDDSDNNANGNNVSDNNVNDNNVNGNNKIRYSENNNLDKFKNSKNCIYDCIFNPENIFSKLSCDKLCEYYTTNKKFLLDTQNLTDCISNINFKTFDLNESYELINVVNNIKNEKNFIEKYQYLEIPFLKDLNNNPAFLQILSLYNLFSPLFNILLPVLMLMMPFLLMILKGKSINIENYLLILCDVFKDNAIGKLFSNFGSSSTGEKCGLIFWALLYLYQIYNSAYYCYKFFINIKFIHNKIFTIKEYLNKSLCNFNSLYDTLKKYDSYKEFNNNLQSMINRINILINNVNKISEYKIAVNKLLELGDLMRMFYILHDNDEINEVLDYSFYLNGYIDNLKQLSLLKQSGKINNCNFSDKLSIKNNFYGIHVNEDYVTNSVDLCKNIVITGPNASGKTTTIKSILVNILLSQQFGVGCYKSAEINLFDKFFCYLNIPDTNDRDSLFQAEAKICKNIIEYLDNNEDDKCLCIFDELYSGTNPEEAINSSYSLLNYISNKNCKFMLTTHFNELCKMLNKNNKIKNYNMKVTQQDNEIKFTYKIEKGISNIKGASNVLKKLNYPEKILQDIDLLRKSSINKD